MRMALFAMLEMTISAYCYGGKKTVACILQIEQLCSVQLSSAQPSSLEGKEETVAAAAALSHAKKVLLNIKYAERELGGIESEREPRVEKFGRERER